MTPKNPLVRPRSYRDWLRKVEQLRASLLFVSRKRGTPLYVFDSHAVRQNICQLRDAFAQHGVPLSVFYAVKSNPYPGLLRAVVEESAGMDVSSGRELTLALDAGAQSVIFTGPVKNVPDLERLITQCEDVTVNLESVREFDLLAEVAARVGKRVRCGLRVTTSVHRAWAKFGLPLSELRLFYERARAHASLQFCGIHFHISWNTTPAPYVTALGEVAAYLRREFSASELEDFTYVDIGGGFVPPSPIGDYSWNPEGTADKTLLEDTLPRILADEIQPRYTPTPSCTAQEYADAIAPVFKTQIKPLLPRAALMAEPGRFVSHDCMHMLLTLVEKKSDRVGITDGGTNMIGWEKFQYCFYAPVFNLTHFSTEREVPFLLYGSLCTPDDVWGYYLYCSKVKEGDVLCVPFQGAYTYTLAQNFIREIPDVVEL